MSHIVRTKEQTSSATRCKYVLVMTPNSDFSKTKLCAIPSWLKLVILTLAVMAYMIAGAGVFMALEGPAEDEERVLLHQVRRQFLEEHTCITDAELEQFILEVVTAADRGVSAVKNVSMVPNWSFGQSVFFAATVMTTIGYGHVAPLSNGGKGFCIVFALIGIPLTLIMFTAIVDRLLVPTNLFLRFLKKKLDHLHKDLHIRLLHLTIVLLVVLLFMYVIPSIILSTLEKDWDFFSSFYYCFISLTTIGLGDYIPGDDPDQQDRPIYKLAVTGYLFIGLISMMLLLAVIYEIPELNIGLHFYLNPEGDVDPEEKTRLRTDSTDAGPRYMQQTNDATSYQRPGTTNEQNAISEETGD